MGASIPVSPLQNICETLVYIQARSTTRAASSIVKKGLVYIQGKDWKQPIRIANSDALLVLTGEVTIAVGDNEYTVHPWEVETCNEEN